MCRSDKRTCGRAEGQTAVALEGAESGVRLGEECDVLEQPERGAGERLRRGGAHVPRRLADDRNARVRFVDVGDDAPDDGPCGRGGGTGCCRCISGRHAAVSSGFCGKNTVAGEKNGRKKRQSVKKTP